MMTIPSLLPLSACFFSFLLPFWAKWIKRVWVYDPRVMLKGAVRMGWQQGDPNSLVSSLDISCSCSEIKKRKIKVCGTTDRHTIWCASSRQPPAVCWGDKEAASRVSSSNWRYITWGSAGHPARKYSSLAISRRLEARAQTQECVFMTSSPVPVH